jgi:transposase
MSVAPTTIRVIIPLTIRKRNGRPKILPPADMMPTNDGGVDPHVLKAIARAWSWRRKLETGAHDYKRNGTTTLFAALNILDGTVIGRNMQRHRHQEFIRFLNTINASVPSDKAVHVILDNYAAHKHPKGRAWLDRHPRFTFHFTPTSCSWLNAVEGFFAKLTKRRLKRGVFQSVVDLQAAINRFVAEHNDKPKPFTWTADPNKIIAAVKKGHQALDSIH